MNGADVRKTANACRAKRERVRIWSQTQNDPHSMPIPTVCSKTRGAACFTLLHPTPPERAQTYLRHSLSSLCSMGAAVHAVHVQGSNGRIVLPQETRRQRNVNGVGRWWRCGSAAVVVMQVRARWRVASGPL